MKGYQSDHYFIIQSKSKPFILGNVQLLTKSYSYTCDRSIDLQLWIIVREGWFAIHPPNTKHQENKNLHVTQIMCPLIKKHTIVFAYILYVVVHALP